MNPAWADKLFVMQLVPGGAANVQVTTGWTGDAELRFLPCAEHELADSAPVRVGAGHGFTMGLTINSVTVLADLRAKAHADGDY